MMYLRPGNLAKEMFIARPEDTISDSGRHQKRFASTGERLKGVLAEAKTEERIRWEQLQHPITHTIVQKGKPKAQTSDMLTLDGRSFFVQGTDDVGALGVWSIYYAEERFDINGGSG